MRSFGPLFVIAMLVAGWNAAARDDTTPDVRRLSFKTWPPMPLAVDAAGRLLAVRTSCECVVYDLETNAERHRWNDGTSVVQFSRDGRFLLATGRNRVTLCDTEDFGERVRITGNPPDGRTTSGSYRPRPAISDDTQLIAIPNDRRCFDRGEPAGMLLYDGDGRLRHTLPLPEDAAITSAEFLRGDRLLLSYASVEEQRRDFRYELWNPQTGQCIHAFPRGEIATGTPGGRLIAVGRSWPTPWRLRDERPTAMKLAIHEIDSGRQLGVLEDPAALTDLVWHPRGTRLLAAVGDRVVEWDMTMIGGDFVVTFDVDDGRPHASVAYAPDGRRRYATIEEPNGVDDDAEYLLRGWDAATDERLPIDRVVVGVNSFKHVVFLPKQDRFIDMAAGWKTEIRDVHTGKTVQTIPDHPASVSTVAFLDDDHFLIDDLLTDGVTGHQRRWRLPGYSHRGSHTAIRSGRAVLSCSTGVFITDTASGITTWRMGPYGFHGPRDVAADPDGRRLVIATNIEYGTESRLIVLDPSRPDEPLVLHRHATAVAVRPDARTVLAASPAAIDELDIDTGEPLRSFPAPPGRVLFIAWSADGSRILVGGVRGHDDVNQPITPEDAGWVVVIDAATGRTTALEGHAGPVTTGVFSPDGRRCATGSLDTTIRLWATASGEEIRCFRGHRGPVRRITCSPRGDRLLTAADDGAAMWNLAGVVDPAIPPATLAKTFQVVETVNAGDGPAATASRVLPASWGDSVPSPPAARVGWPVVRVGDELDDRIDRFWLKHAKTVATVPVAQETAAPPSFPGHQLLGTSGDGRRRLLESPPPRGRSILVADERDRVLARVDAHLAGGEAAAIAPVGDAFVIVRRVAAPPRPRADGRYQFTVYDAATGLATRTFEPFAAWNVHAARIDPLGRTLLLQINNDVLDLRDFTTGRQLARIEAPLLHAAYSPDGRFIVTHRTSRSAVELRDPRSLEVIRTLENHLPVHWCRATPDGRRLLVGQSYADHVELVTSWDVDRGTRLGSQCGPAAAAVAGTFSADGRLYLVENRLHVWSLWDVERGRIRCVVVSRSYSPLDTPVFGSDGESLHRGSPDGPRLWPVGDH